MTSTTELRRTWAGHTAVEQLCDALDCANTSIINWFHNAVYWQRHTGRLRDHWMAAWRRAHQAEHERDEARARVVELEIDVHALQTASRIAYDNLRASGDWEACREVITRTLTAVAEGSLSATPPRDT